MITVAKYKLYHAGPISAKIEFRRQILTSYVATRTEKNCNDYNTGIEMKGE